MMILTKFDCDNEPRFLHSVSQFSFLASSLEKLRCQSVMSNQIDPPFSQGVGYGLIIGVSALFAIGMSTVVGVLERFFAEK